MKIPRIVLTGGPCGGKTTVQRALVEQLVQRGFRPLCVPEVATLVFGTGLTINDFLPDKIFHLQKAILRMQIALEDSLEDPTTVIDQKPVILCDRGVMDGKGYCTPGQWEQILQETNVSEENLLSRYELVIHLTTAADGAEGHYSSQTNACRFESVAQALDTDNKLRGAWAGHPRHVIISNAGGMPAKLASVMDKLDEFLNGYVIDKFSETNNMIPRHQRDIR